MRITFLPVLFLLSFFVSGFKPVNDDPYKRIADWQKLFHPEKAYLHFDKPYYTAGDTMWFKAYVTIGSKNQLSAVSGAVYAELINENDSVIHYHKLPLLAGMAKGDFVLPSNLLAGTYRVRAYTQWMRNKGPGYFYDNTFKISALSSETISSESNFNIKDGKLMADISYKNADKIPLGNMKVEYELKSADARTKQGSATTSDKGKILLKLDTAGFNGSDVRLIMRLKDPKGNSILKSFPINLSYSASDIRFYPEGGSLINGILSKVAFKCVGINGLGVPVQITVRDNKQNIIASSTSLHAGMGVFTIRPQSGARYHAIVRFPDNLETRVELPQAKDNGYVLSVYNDVNPDSILVRIYASEFKYRDANEVSLMAQSAGEVHFSTALKVKGPRNSVWIPKNILPQGIIQFTLFADNGEPLNERLAFSHKTGMKVLLNTDKSSYSARSNIKVDIDAKDAEGKPSVGNFSVSVVNEDLAPENHVTGSSILSGLLLSSDIEGYVEEPNYYFSDTSSKVKTALDALLLTQGYRKFIWKEILSGSVKEPLYSSEKLTMPISGSLLTLGRKPIQGGKITLMSEKLGILTDTLTDSSGRFRFSPLLLQDGVKFVVQGRNTGGGDKVLINMDMAPRMNITSGKNIADLAYNTDSSFNAFKTNTTKEFAEIRKNGGVSLNNELGTVVISSKKPVTVRSFNLNGPGNSDQEIKGTEFENCGGTLLSCLQGLVRGVFFNAGIAYSTRNAGSAEPVPMLLVVDGREITSEDIDYAAVLEQSLINSSDIQNVEVLRTSGYTNIYGSKGTGGVLLITMKPGWTGLRGKEASGILTFVPKGYYKSKEFYLPRYDVKEIPKNYTAPRTTVYWNPSIITDKEGRASFNFFNSGSAGTYRVTLEGINEAGHLARSVYRYKVLAGKYVSL